MSLGSGAASGPGWARLLPAPPVACSARSLEGGLGQQVDLLRVGRGEEDQLVAAGAS